MSKAQENTLIFAGLLSLGIGALAGYLAHRTGLMVFHALLPFYIVAAFTCGLAAFRLRMNRVSEEERLDLEGARARGVDTSIFTDEEQGDAQPFTLARSREQVEKFVVPAITPVLVFVLARWSWGLFKKIDLALDTYTEGLLATSFLIGIGFVLFLVSRYLVGVSGQPGLRLCRGPGIDTALASVGSFGAAVATLLGVWFGAKADHLAAYILAGLLAVLALEKLIFYIAACYHPRRLRMLGMAAESRLGNFIADPGAWAGSVAHTVDYQFGIDVSENWYKRMFKRTLMPMFGALAALVYLMSCFVFLAPHEQGVLEHFGKPAAQGAVLESGLHVKLPWPFEAVRRVPAKRIQTAYLGFKPHADDPRPEVVSWTVPHYEKEDLVVLAAGNSSTNATESTPVSLMTMNIPIQYRITNVHHYVYSVADPQPVFDRVAQRALALELAGLDHARFKAELRAAPGGARISDKATEIELLTSGRNLIADRLRANIQSECDRLKLGIGVEFVGLQGVHPPVAVAEAYQDVVGALELKEAMILEARAYAATVLPYAEAEAEQTMQRMLAYRETRRQSAEAEAARFTRQVLAFEASPQVYGMRTYLELLENALEGTRKYVVDSRLKDLVIILDTEEEVIPPFLGSPEGEPSP